MIKKYTVEGIKKECKNFLNKVADVHKANLDFDSIDVSISSRMSKTKGQCEYTRKFGNVKPLKLKIAKQLIENYAEKDIVSTIHHEMIHLIVDTYTNDFNGHNNKFKAMCRTYGVNDETYFRAEPIKEIDNRYDLVCSECGHVYKYSRLTESSKKHKVECCICGHCNSKLFLVDKKENYAMIRWTYSCKKIRISDLEEYGYKYK